MTALHVQARPFPGHAPTSAPDVTKTAAGALARARRALTGNAVDCPPGCRCSVWCRDEWVYAGHAIGACETCGEPCRSTDPEGRLLHPTCGVPVA